MVVTTRTEGEAKIGRRIAALRFVPVVLAVAVVFWVMVRMIVPYHVEFVVVDQDGQAISGADVYFGASAATRETDAQGRCAIWISRDRDNRHTTVDVRIPELGIHHVEGRSWRDMRRGRATHVTVPLGDTVAGVATSELSGARLVGARASATFVHANRREGPLPSGGLTGYQNQYYGRGYSPYQQTSPDGTFFVTRPPSRPDAGETDTPQSVEVTVWAPAHAPRKLILEPSRMARGHAFFDAGDVVLSPWARAKGQLQAQGPDGVPGHMGLLRAVVWSPALDVLEGIRGDPTLEKFGRDSDRPYAVLRSMQGWNSSFDVTIPVPADRVVLIAIAHDRPPLIVEVAAESVSTLAPDGWLAGYDRLVFPAPNPMTLPFVTADGGVVPFAQVTFARFLPGTEIAIPLREAPLSTDMKGMLTMPSLEDGERYEITVVRQNGASVTFESVVEPRGEIVVPE